MFDTSRYFPDGYFMNDYFPRYWWFKPSLIGFVTFASLLVRRLIKLTGIKND